MSVHSEYRTVFNISGETVAFECWAYSARQAYQMAVRACAFLYEMSRQRVRGFKYVTEQVR